MGAPAKRPDPAEQLRERMVLAKAAGAPFDMAWDRAWDRVEWPHETPHRRAWKRALGWSREGWRAAYEETAAPTDELTSPGVLV